MTKQLNIPELRKIAQDFAGCEQHVQDVIPGSTLPDSPAAVALRALPALLDAAEERDALKASMLCKGCNGTVGDHFAPDQGGCPGNFEMDGISMVPLSCWSYVIRERDALKAKLAVSSACVNGLNLKLDLELDHTHRFKAELDALRADIDAAKLILPVCCGSLADAADTLRQERDALKAKLAALVEAASVVSEALETDDIITWTMRSILDEAIAAAKAAP